MTKAEVTTSDSFVQLFSNEVTNTYFKKDKPIVKHGNSEFEPNLLYSLIFSLSADVLIAKTKYLHFLGFTR